MRLAAIYIEEHDYLFNEPQTINFGGKYFYSFRKEKKNIIVSRTVNENFIPGFFDLTSLTLKVTNVNAIVGQNGAGKSTLLDIIRSEFIENKYALPYSKSLFLVELDDKPEPVILRNDFANVYLVAAGVKRTRKQLKIKLTKTPQTIYYSPHFDYKYNPNFDTVDNHDISFDKIVEQDLEEFREKDTNESGFPYSASQELLFKNSLRQIQFLSSELVKKQNIFQDLFQLQEHYEPILYFRGYLGGEREWNTPYQLRKILKLIDEKAETEVRDWHKVRKFKRDRVINQLEVNQYILKRNVIKCILSLLYRQMERKNSFLEEGFFPYEKFDAKLKTVDAYQAFIIFAKQSSIKFRTSKPIKIFRDNILEKLINKIYETIDKTDNEASVTNKTLTTSPEDAVAILKLQRNFLNELNNYYIKFYSNKKNLQINEREKVEEFINYMPFSRRMSSGENSLLNFFSRIYNFLHSNLKETRFRKASDHYILLLDEADLTFHLSWKKKYVKAILKTLPHFFNELKNKPTIEIIFTTHDPFALSDLPNPNVIYIERPDYSSSSTILDYGNSRRPLKTFGANISDLIADSFFIENSLIGDFAFDKIQDSIKWLNDEKNLEEADYHKKIIQFIDEPIVQRKLAEMYDEKMKENLQIDVINKQISMLEELRKKLKL